MSTDVLSTLVLRPGSLPLSALAQSPLRGRFVLPFSFGSTSAPDSDPGAGVLSINGNAHSNTTVLRIDDLGTDGVSYRALLSELAVKDSIIIQSASNANQWALYNVTAVAQLSGYSNVSVSYVAGPGGYSGALSVLVAWAGDHRFELVQIITLAAGTYHNVEIDARARIVEFVPTGDVLITGFKLVAGPVAPPGSGGVAPTAGNLGGSFVAYKHGFSGRLILKNYDSGSVTANQIGTPSTVDFVLDYASNGTAIHYTATYSKWQPLARNMGQIRNDATAALFVRDITNLIMGVGVTLGFTDNASLRATNLTVGLRALVGATNYAAPIVWRVSCPAGSAGVADDVLITAATTFGMLLFDEQLMTSTAGMGGSSGHVRSGPNGTGVSLCSPLSTAATGLVRGSRNGSNVIGNGTPLYFRRTDGAHVGELILWALPL